MYKVGCVESSVVLICHRGTADHFACGTTTMWQVKLDLLSQEQFSAGEQ